MSKFGKNKIALFLAVTQVLGGRTSAMNAGSKVHKMQNVGTSNTNSNKIINYIESHKWQLLGSAALTFFILGGALFTKAILSKHNNNDDNDNSEKNNKKSDDIKLNNSQKLNNNKIIVFEGQKKVNLQIMNNKVNLYLEEERNKSDEEDPFDEKDYELVSGKSFNQVVEAVVNKIISGGFKDNFRDLKYKNGETMSNFSNFQKICPDFMQPFIDIFSGKFKLNDKSVKFLGAYNQFNFIDLQDKNNKLTFQLTKADTELSSNNDQKNFDLIFSGRNISDQGKIVVSLASQKFSTIKYINFMFDRSDLFK